MSLDKSTRAEIKRELKALDKQEREIQKPVKDLARAYQKLIKAFFYEMRDRDRELDREIKTANRATAKLRARRAILQGRLS